MTEIKKKNIFICIFTVLFFISNICLASSARVVAPNDLEYAATVGGGNASTKDAAYYKNQFENEFRAAYYSSNAETQKNFDNVVNDIRDAISSNKLESDMENIILTTTQKNVSDGNLRVGVSTKIKNILTNIGYYDYAKQIKAKMDGSNTSIGNGFDYNNVPSNGNTPTNFKTVIDRVWGTASLILKIAAIGGVIFAGIRYMYSSADAKADLKKSLVPLIIGIVIVFAASTLVDFIVSIFNSAV